MANRYNGGKFSPVYMPGWYLVLEQVVAGNDADQNVTVPDGAQIIEIRPEGGDCYLTNGLHATANSGFYIPEDNGEIIGPLVNWAAIVSVWAATGTTVHIVWFREDNMR